MDELTAIRQAARKVKDEHGNDVMQIPIEVWEEVFEDEAIEEHTPSQIEQIMAVIKEWENIPDDKSQEWWDEFDAFLKDNRVNFEERDLGFDEE